MVRIRSLTELVGGVVRCGVVAPVTQCAVVNAVGVCGSGVRPDAVPEAITYSNLGWVRFWCRVGMSVGWGWGVGVGVWWGVCGGVFVGRGRNRFGWLSVWLVKCWVALALAVDPPTHHIFL